MPRREDPEDWEAVGSMKLSSEPGVKREDTEPQPLTGDCLGVCWGWQWEEEVRSH